MSYKQDNGNSASSRTALLAYKPSHSLSLNQDTDKANYNTISGANATSEKKPLLNSMNAAAESLVNNSVMGGDIQTGVSWGMAAFLLVNTALGAGMLNYPYAYNQIGGVLAASLMQVILLIFIASTMFILVYCADFNRDNTYHDVLLSMCGKRAQQISALSILITCYGINITFLIIIGDQYDRIFSSLLDPDYLQASGWFLDRKFTILATSILFIWPMCYAQRLDFLRHASVLGMFAMLYVAFLTVYEHFKLDEATIAAVTARLHTAPDQLLTATPTPALANSSGTLATVATATAKQIKWFEPITVVPVLCFAYQSHEVIVPVYACMRERFIGSFMKATIFGLVILFLLYNLVGAFGYLTFGENVGADIMSLYDAQDPVVVVGIVALVIKFITTYPPLMFCGRSALDGLYGEFRKLSTDEFKSNEPTRRYVISTLWFLSTVALAVFAPDISVTLQLLGSMASINVFVFPGMCLVSLTRRLRRARQSILIGELPEGFNPHKHQMAKDYYLISGTYFNEAIKRNASLKYHHNQQQQQQRLNQNCALYGAASGGKCCASAPAFKAGATAGAAAAVTGSNYAHVDGGDTKAKSFTATFASLIEFENNVINNGAGEGSCSNTLNGAGSSGRGTGEILSSISTTSSSSSSSSASSSQERQLTATNSSLLLNGGSSSHLSNRTNRDSGAADEQVQFRSIQRRQEEFERLVTNGSNCCVMNNHNSLSTDQQQQQQSHGPLANYNNHHSYSSCGPVCHGGNRTINDSYDDYSNCLDGCLSNGYQEHLHTNHQQHSQHLHSHPNHQHHHHHHHCDNYQPYNECDKITTNPLMISHKSQQYSLSSSLRATTSSYNILKQRALANNDGTQQQLLSDKFSDSISGSGAGANYYDDNYHMADRQPGDRSTAGGANPLRPPHCHHCRHSNGQLSYRQQCLQNSLNYAYNQSTTGSLLDKLGSSIAPSTVAQVGISQCTATGLYLFSILLIVFGAFIFFLELANVFGFL